MMKISMVNKLFFVILVGLFAAKDYLIKDGSDFYLYLSIVVVAAICSVADWSDEKESGGL